MSTDVVNKAPTPVEDEKEAIMSLLGLHSSTSGGNSKRQRENSELEGKADESEETDDDETTGVASPVHKKYDDDSSTTEEESLPQTRAPRLESSMHINMGMPLRRIGKKRKKHASVDGQYEDAHESFFPSFPIAKPAVKYNEYSMPPPPPHLIQQTSNEYVPHAQTTAELARHALAFQQRSMMTEANSLFPSPRLAAMMAGPSMTGPNMNEMYERRLQMEAMMAFQAKMHFARQAGAHGISSIAGMSGPMGAFGSASLSRMNGNMGMPPSSTNPESADGSESDEEDPKKLAFAMRPPSSPQANRVESEDDEEDPYKKVTLPDSCKKAKNPIPFSTKERYERYTPPPSWGKLTKVPKMPPVKADNKVKDPITDIKENDVLLGRGGLTNTNPGNIKFRKLVSKYRVHYCTAPKGDKGALSRYLCNYVRAMNGRFLSKAPDGPAWYEVGDEKAISKCGQALREGTAEFNRKEIESFGTTI